LLPPSRKSEPSTPHEKDPIAVRPKRSSTTCTSIPIIG
jgi:hypothetical protein